MRVITSVTAGEVERRVCAAPSRAGWRVQTRSRRFTNYCFGLALDPALSAAGLFIGSCGSSGDVNLHVHFGRRPERVDSRIGLQLRERRGRHRLGSRLRRRWGRSSGGAPATLEVVPAPADADSPRAALKRGRIDTRSEALMSTSTHDGAEACGSRRPQ